MSPVVTTVSTCFSFYFFCLLTFNIFELEIYRILEKSHRPGNWMLFESYDAASRGDYNVTRGMLELFSKPYDEQPIFEEAYFRTAPHWAKSGGIYFMS